MTREIAKKMAEEFVSHVPQTDLNIIYTITYGDYDFDFSWELNNDTENENFGNVEYYVEPRDHESGELCGVVSHGRGTENQIADTIEFLCADFIWHGNSNR